MLLEVFRSKYAPNLTAAQRRSRVPMPTERKPYQMPEFEVVKLVAAVLGSGLQANDDGDVTVANGTQP